VREVEQRRREIKNKKCREKDWPNKQHVDGYVDWVPVISAIESKVLLKVKYSDLSH
jgi:hypothetical protein